MMHSIRRFFGLSFFRKKQKALMLKWRFGVFE
jgi:hypothetical protein